MGQLVLASITSSLTDFIGRNGVYAVCAIMALDALLPVGDELAMLYAGALAGGRSPSPTSRSCSSSARSPRWRSTCAAAACDLRLTPVVPDPYTPVPKSIPATDGASAPSPGACCP
jgi:hypothetical protein